LGILARSRKDYPLALKELETSLALADERGDDLARTAALNNLALVLADLGELEMAILKARQALEISHRLGDLHRQAALHSNLADLLHEIGREEEALQHLTESVKIFSQVGGQSSELKPDIWKLTEW
jgi:tetratricopeptide (TPR) repeat protein